MMGMGSSGYVWGGRGQNIPSLLRKILAMYLKLWDLE